MILYKIIEQSNTSIGEIHIDVHGLGLFNPVANLVTSAFANGVANLTSVALDNLFPLVNTVLNEVVLPVSADIKQLAE